MEGIGREAERKRVAVTWTGGDKTVDKDGGSAGGEGGTESVDIS